MPYISQKTIDEIQSRANITAIAGEYVRLEQRGTSFWGLCPFHNEKTASFTVNPERNSYYCFGCHEGGGLVNFIMQMEKLNFGEALTFLAKKLGIRIEYEESGGASRRQDEDALRFKDDLAELYRRVAGSFNHILLETPEGRPALEYVQKRGIGIETIRRFRLGFAPRDKLWLHKFLEGRGYSNDFLAKSALFSRNYSGVSLFSNRLMFPINDRAGKTVAFGGRILEGDGPKYLNSPDSPVYHKRETLFALDEALKEIRGSKEVYLCEGYMDVLALHHAGVRNSVAPLGTAFTDEQAKLLRRWAERVNLLFDTDAAGEDATFKAILVCRSSALGCAVVTPRLESGVVYKDPADILLEAGEEALSKSVKNIILDADYLTAQSKKRFVRRPDDAQGIAKAVAYLIPFYQSIDSEAERDAFSRRFALALGVEPSAVQHDLKNGQEKKAVYRRAENDNIKRTIIMNEELYLLTAAAVNLTAQPDLWNSVRECLPVEEFESTDARELYYALEECLRSSDLRFEAVLERISNLALRDFLAEKGAGREFSDRKKEIVSDGIRGVKIKHLERR
ncbi:MAG: DNA primase, partial [Spirochaetaceae bacterium]|nr:DNA primase [Spirochaetaceae bacterium]